MEKCTHCQSEFKKNFKEHKFCSKSCSNKHRKISKETKEKISKSIGKIREPKPFGKRWLSSNKNLDYSKLVICKCKKCGFVGSYRTQMLYCKSCENCYTENGRAKYIFTFNVYNYPDLFDLDFINKHGWRKTKGDNININGVSRDHKVSVHEALLNDYDPYYIKHPLNCQIMLHSENQSKGTNSSMTYNELVKLVDEYESK